MKHSVDMGTLPSIVRAEHEAAPKIVFNNNGDLMSGENRRRAVKGSRGSASL